jgi:non-ribosomal peptide synthetase-like protein
MGEEQEEPRTETEAKLLEAAKSVLPPQAIPFDADFFTDLGGHSLLAARFLALVRKHHELSSLTLQDVYEARSLRAMGELLDGRAKHMAPPRDLSFTPPPLLRRFLCGLAQAVTLPIVLALMTAQWLGVFVSYMLLTDANASLLQEMVSLIGVYISINIATVVVGVAMKWILLGRMKPGRYPLWGGYYFRWWLAQRFLGLLHVKWFQGSPIMRIYLRALGARIGDDALIGEAEFGAPDLVSIGAGASLGSKLKFANARVEGNELIIGRIEIGADAYIGTSCVIEEDVVIGRSAEIRDLTSIPSGSRLAPCEIWDGSPARMVGMVDLESLPPQADASPGLRAAQTAVYTFLLLVIPCTPILSSRV